MHLAIVLVCISLAIDDMEHLFMRLFRYLHMLCLKMSLRVFALFPAGLFVFQWCFEKSLLSWILAPYWIPCLFILFKGAFTEQTFLNLMRPNSSIFLYMDCSFSKSTNSLPCLGRKYFLLLLVSSTDPTALSGNRLSHSSSFLPMSWL